MRRGAALVLVLVSVGCASAAKREEENTHHWIGRLIPYTLKARRPPGDGAHPSAGPGGEDYVAHPRPDARLDCQSLAALFGEIKLPEARACLESLVKPAVVLYHLRRETQPYLELDDDKDTPACLKSALPRVPVPREVVYQSTEEGDLRCYASRLDLEANQRLGLKLPLSRMAVRADFPLRDKIKTDAELRMLFMSWVMSLFRSEENQLWDGRILPDHLCETCLGRKEAWKPGDAPLPHWPGTLLED